MQDMLLGILIATALITAAVIVSLMTVGLGYTILTLIFYPGLPIAKAIKQYRQQNFM